VVRHELGEDSIITLSSYDQGRTKWQAETLTGVWFDEEPPLPIYQEGKTRVQVEGGPVITTFTPLLGMSEVVQLFMPLEDKPLAPGRILINMTLEDALHYSPERRAEIIAGYTDADRDARAFGRPVMGEGLVFPVSESAIRVDPFPIPNWWRRICGIDFGWDHPFAAVWLAYDGDTDTIYVYREYREAKATIGTHAMNMLPQGKWIPVAWPHDGHKHDPKSGKAYSQIYRDDYELKMLPTHATFGDDKDQQNYGFEAGISEMLDRMQTGRWKVFSTCVKWFEEFKGMHRLNGQVVKLRDDLISASRIAMMMRRHAVSPVEMRLNGTTNVRTATAPKIAGFGVLDRETGY
jgi:phage terminase large subunit-like protein